jgi:thiamine-phosphate pyrophosphorylase
VIAAPFDLMLIVDPRVEGALAALAAWPIGGQRVAVQLRAKDASDVALLAMAREIAAVQPPMSRLLVNGRVPVARAIAADGVHLPESAEPAHAVRGALAAGALVGASCHDAAGVAQRAAEGADYVLLGPLGSVPGKPALAHETFAEIARTASAPVIALGGIASAAEADRAMSLGASGIAIARALLDTRARESIATWLARSRSA